MSAVDNERYRGAAVLPGTPRSALCSIAALLVLCLVLFFLTAQLPYGALMQVAVVVFAAFALNYILKKGTFSVTYILTDSELIVLSRYGFIEKESARYALEHVVITKDAITANGKRHPFYPDAELRTLLDLG